MTKCVERLIRTDAAETTHLDPGLHSNRRRLLLALGLGAGAALPGQWSRPVVETVLLPAHAQTTTPEPDSNNPGSDPTAETCTQLPLTLDLGRASLYCPSAPQYDGFVGVETQAFYIDDSGECPVLLRDNGETGGSGPPSQIAITFELDDNTGEVRCTFSVRNSSAEKSVSLGQTCDPVQELSTLSFSELCLSTSGATWIASGKLFRDDHPPLVSVYHRLVQLTPL